MVLYNKAPSRLSVFLIVNNNLFSQSPTHNKHANSLIFTLSSHLFFLKLPRKKQEQKTCIFIQKDLYNYLTFFKPRFEFCFENIFLNILF